MSRHPLLPAALSALALSLVACDRTGTGTTITINGSDGNMIGLVDGKSGDMKIDVPGFSGRITMPKIRLDASNFDLNGVHLYPGSTIDTMNVGKAAAGANREDEVRVGFTSPASPEVVRAWFGERLGKVGYTVRPAGSGLVGTTDEGKPFALDLIADGAGKARGTIVLGG